MKSKLVRRTGFSLAGILTVLSALWWLWGNSTPYYLEAVGDLVRRHAADRSPELLRSSRRKTSKRLRKTPATWACSSRKWNGRSDRSTRTSNGSSPPRRPTRRRSPRLAEQLRSVKPEERVVINHKTFTREDIENDATVVLDRCRARKTQIEELRTYRTEEVAARDDVRGDLRERCDRIRRAVIGQNHIRQLLEQERFVRSWSALCGPQTADHIGQAEEKQANLLAELTAKKAISGLTPSSATPVVDALGAQYKPDVEAEIAKALHGKMPSEK